VHDSEGRGLAGWRYVVQRFVGSGLLVKKDDFPADRIQNQCNIRTLCFRYLLSEFQPADGRSVAISFPREWRSGLNEAALGDRCAARISVMTAREVWNPVTDLRDRPSGSRVPPAPAEEGLRIGR
jgi:hypothetical protein